MNSEMWGKKMNSKLILPKQNENSFVGRISEIEEFWKIYNSVSKENYKIINYYGMTGIGKSKLLNKIENDIKSQKSYCIKIDMDFCLKKEVESDYISQSKEEILLKLRNKLIDEYKFKFDKFDQILYKYYERIGISKDKPEFQMLLSRNENVSNIIDIAKDLIGPLGIPVNIFKLIDMGVTSITRGRKNDMNLDDDSYEQLYEYLQYVFAFDLNENVSKLNSPLVILIDTYEMIQKESFGKGNQKNNDKWLRNENGVIPNTKNVLWVIAGRDELEWEEIERQKIEVIKHKLLPLNEGDSVKLLKEASVDDLELCKQIWKRCEGVPKYLSLCIEQYITAKQENKEIDISLFEKNLEIITDNLIRYMGINDQEILYYLACLDSWNDEFIRNRGCKFITCFSYIRYNNLKQKSFVDRNDNGYYALSKIARDSIRKSCIEDIKIIVNDNMSEYYMDMLNSKLTVEQEVEIILGYAKRAIEKQDSDDVALENYNRIKEHLEKLEGMFKFVEVAKVLKIVNARLNNNNEITQKYINALIRAGEYNFALQIVNSYIERNKEDNEIQILAKAMLGELYTYIGKNQEAVELLEQAYWEKLEILKEDDVCLLEKLANSYARVEKRQKALEIYQRILDEGTSLNEKLTRRNMINTYSQLGMHEEAIKMYNELISITNENSLEILALNNNKAMSMSRLGKNEEAYEILKVVYKKRKEFLGENYPETINTLYNMAIVLSHLSRFDEAITLYNEVYEKRVKLLGANHPKTIDTKNGIGMTYFYKGDYENALKLVKEAYEERGTLGENSKDVIVSLKNLGIIYKGLNQQEMSKNFFEQALEKAKSLLEENSPLIKKIENEM